MFVIVIEGDQDGVVGPFGLYESAEQFLRKMGWEAPESEEIEWTNKPFGWIEGMTLETARIWGLSSPEEYCPEAAKKD